MEKHPSLAPGGEDSEKERTGAWVALPRVEESLGTGEGQSDRAWGVRGETNRIAPVPSNMAA